jgi:hypothetical protein
MQFNLPSSPASNMYIFSVFKENMIKFKKFTTQILNPGTISELILKFGHLSVNQINQ